MRSRARASVEAQRRSGSAGLTVREEQILRIIRLSVEGLTAAEIGAAVGLRNKGSAAYCLCHPRSAVLWSARLELAHLPTLPRPRLGRR